MREQAAAKWPKAEREGRAGGSSYYSMVRDFCGKRSVLAVADDFTAAAVKQCVL